jgi:hypothetical protein
MRPTMRPGVPPCGRAHVHTWGETAFVQSMTSFLLRRCPSYSSTTPAHALAGITRPYHYYCRIHLGFASTMVGSSPSSSSQASSSASASVYTPETYRALKTEQGVFMTPPYSTDIKQHWKFVDEAAATKSTTVIWDMFEDYRYVCSLSAWHWNRESTERATVAKMTLWGESPIHIQLYPCLCTHS